MRCDTPPTSPLRDVTPRATPTGRWPPRPSGSSGGTASPFASRAAIPSLAAAAATAAGRNYIMSHARAASDADDAGSRAASPSASAGAPSTPPGAWVAALQQAVVGHTAGQTAGQTASQSAGHSMLPLSPQVGGSVGTGSGSSGGAGSGGGVPLVLQMQQALTRFGVEHRRSFNSSTESASPLLMSMRAAAARLRLSDDVSREGTPDDTVRAAGAAAGQLPFQHLAAPVHGSCDGEGGMGAQERQRPRKQFGRGRDTDGNGDDSSDEDYVPGEEDDCERGPLARHHCDGGSGGHSRSRRGWSYDVASDGDEPRTPVDAAAAAAHPASGELSFGVFTNEDDSPSAATAAGQLRRAWDEGPVRGGSAPPGVRAEAVAWRPQGSGRKGGRSSNKEPKASSKGPCANCGVEKSILWRCHPLDDSVRLCNACGECLGPGVCAVWKVAARWVAAGWGICLRTRVPLVLHKRKREHQFRLVVAKSVCVYESVCLQSTVLVPDHHPRFLQAVLGALNRKSPRSFTPYSSPPSPSLLPHPPPRVRYLPPQHWQGQAH